MDKQRIMPKEISHIIIAQDVLTSATKAGEALLAKTIKKNQAVFFWGAILPDAFFYDLAYPFFLQRAYPKKISHALHSKNGTTNVQRAKKFFSSIAWKSHMWDVKFALASGVMTHVVSDRIIHSVIDYYVNYWNQEGFLATTTHREMETWIDMVLLNQWNQHPSDIRLKKKLHVPRHLRKYLLSFYLDHMSQDGQPAAPYLLNALRRSNFQHHFLLKLFRTNTLFPVMASLNTLCGGKLRPWASLVYPKAITYKAFPFLNHLEVDTLTDGRSFKGSLTDLAAKATMRAQAHILEEFKAMKARKSEKIFSLTPPSKR